MHVDRSDERAGIVEQRSQLLLEVTLMLGIAEHAPREHERNIRTLCGDQSLIEGFFGADSAEHQRKARSLVVPRPQLIQWHAVRIVLEQSCRFWTAFALRS